MKRNKPIVIGPLNKDLKEINRARASVGLAPIKVGKRLCLKCNKEFESRDLRNNKMCQYCLDHIIF